MSDFSVPGALSKSFDIEKNYRAHKVFTEYERYRKKFFNDVNLAVDDTNFLVEISNDTDAKKYIRKASPRNVRKLPNVQLTPELIEKFKNSNPRSEKGATYNPKLAAKLLADTKKYTFRMAPINRTGNPQKKVDRYPMYHPKSIKNKSQQYLYFPENENTDQLKVTGQSYHSTPHQNTDESSYDSFSNPPDIPEGLFSKSNYQNKSKDTLVDDIITVPSKDTNETAISGYENQITLNKDSNEAAISGDENQIILDKDSGEVAISQEVDNDIPADLSNKASLEQSQQNEDRFIVFEEEEEEPDDDINYNQSTNIVQVSDSNLDTRPSNCGNSPNGSSDFVIYVSAPKFLDYCSNKYGYEINNLSDVPPEEYESFQTHGFNWAYFKDIPQNTNIRSLTALLHLARLLILTDFDDLIDPSFADGIVFNQSITEEIRNQYPNKLLIGSAESDYADYFYDERPINCLRNQDPVSFMKCIKEGGIDKQRKIIRFVSVNGLDFNERSEMTAAAMILSLPGMRIIDFTDHDLLKELNPLLNQKVIWNGVFEYVDFTSNGNLCSWKYSRGNNHLLIAANFAVPQNTAHIICNDCPEVPDGEKNLFVDILTETKYYRIPLEVKTKGLCVILYEYEAQIFDY